MAWVLFFASWDICHRFFSGLISNILVQQVLHRRKRRSRKKGAAAAARKSIMPSEEADTLGSRANMSPSATSCMTRIPVVILPTRD